MSQLAISKPRWFAGNDSHAKPNPDVVGGVFPRAEEGNSWLKRLDGLEIFGKSPANAFLRLNQCLWNKLPEPFTALRPMRSHGAVLHGLARIQ
jgi:hypothetical protein